jgi:hypothetical protein
MKKDKAVRDHGGYGGDSRREKDDRVAVALEGEEEDDAKKPLLSRRSTSNTHNINNGETPELAQLFDQLGIRRLEKLGKYSELSAYATIVVSAIVGTVFVYWAFISKFMPVTGVALLDSMSSDHYFCYLFPLMIIPTVMVIYINWLSMRFFESN